MPPNRDIRALLRGTAMKNGFFQYRPLDMTICLRDCLCPVSLIKPFYSKTGQITIRFVFQCGQKKTSRLFRIETVRFLERVLSFCMEVENFELLHSQEFDFQFYEGTQKKRIQFKRDLVTGRIHLKFHNELDIVMSFEELKKFNYLICEIGRRKAQSDRNMILSLFRNNHGKSNP